jgi:hypothetical protein
LSFRALIRQLRDAYLIFPEPAYAALRHHIGQKALCHFFGGCLHIGVMPQQLLETRHLIGQITASFFVAANGMLSQMNCAGT